MFHKHVRETQPPPSDAVRTERNAPQPGPPLPPRIQLPYTYVVPGGDRAGTPFIVQHNDSHFCPWDAAAAFFIVYANRACTSRPPGLYVYSAFRKEWDRVADVEELPMNTWARVLDGSGSPLPLQLCRADTGMVSALWSGQ